MPQRPEDTMSDAPAEQHVESHEGPIRTPRQLMVTVVASFVLPVIVIIGLVNFVVMAPKPSAGNDGLGPEAVAKRIMPVGRVEVRDLSDASALRSGEQVYNAQCTACHLAGAAGAPKTGDAAAWGPRLKSGYEALLNAALKGKGAMGPQGGGDYSDFEIARAVVYLANQGGAKFEEPKAPAAAASAPK
jgi:cytochrome c5